MKKVSVVIPNLNGESYLTRCLDSLRGQTYEDFDVILVDNGSTDGSMTLVRKKYPEVRCIRLDKNYGFCKAVNLGIEASDAVYVILLNNDTEAGPRFIEELVLAMEQNRRLFSCAAKMVQMDVPQYMDNAGDYYNAFGWAYSIGKGKLQENYNQPHRIFSSCAAAAIYRKTLFGKIGLFDEEHFAYLEDVDIGYRANIFGYENWYIPYAQIKHVGSASSGSRYNRFKALQSARNSVYVVYKNMPLLQLLLNFPFLLVGFLAKIIFYIFKGYGLEYLVGLWRGIQLCWKSNQKVPYQTHNLKRYVWIQIQLWINLVRRFLDN